MRKAFLALPLAAALLAGSSTPALANGRFPETNAVFLSPNDPDLVLLRVTFGLLVSHDRGKSWDWICENSIGLAGIEDPMFWVAPNSTIVGSTFQGVSISRDKGCNFAFVGGDLKDGIFVDLTSRAAEPNTVVTFWSGYDNIDEAGVPSYKSVLFESKDQGETFTALPWVFDDTLFGETVDMAPSDADRLYVTAVRTPGVTPTGVFMVSRDRGKTFEELPFPLIAGERAPYIAAVDPTNADHVYVRTWGGSADKPGRIMLTEDAGKNWRAIYTSQAALSGFALAPDGTKVYLGGPKEGLQVASTTDFVFTKKTDIEIGCLTLTEGGLWACSSEKSGFIAAFSKDDGATFETKAHFCDIRGTLECDGASKTTTQCAQVWPTQQSVLGCDALVDGGTGGGYDGGDGTTTTGASVDDDGGCSCRTTPTRPLTAAFASSLGVGAIALLFARRRRARH